jgi:DNA (cytosine-5)-methyltransferase 1
MTTTMPINVPDGLTEHDTDTPALWPAPTCHWSSPTARATPRPPTKPLHTVATRESAALMAACTIDTDDCRFRMLKPREHARAKRFPDDYRVVGNQTEQTMGFGNAVSSNVAQWLGGIVARLLAGAA